MNEPLSKKEQKNFDAMIKRARSSQARHIFYPSFSFPTRETMDAMIDAAKDAGVDNINFNACALGATKTVWFAERMTELKLKTLNISTNAVGQSGIAAVCQKLPETNIETLSIANNNLSDKVSGVILNGLEKSKVRSLDVTNNHLGDKFAVALADVLKQKEMDVLTLSHIEMTDKSAEAFADALPASGLKSLDISNNRLGPEGIEKIISKLPETSLKEINLIGTGLVQENAKDLIKILPDTNITKISFAPQGRPSDKFMETLRAYLEHPSCRLEDADIPLSGLSDYEKNLMVQSLETMRSNARTRRFYQYLAKEHENDAAPADISLGDALSKGVLKQALENRKKENRPLTSEDCFEYLGYARMPFILTAAQAEMLPLIFSAQNWKDPKEMQKAWSALDPKHHWQMDGKKGRPLFQKEKNEVTRRSLAAVLAAKKGKNR